MLKSHDSTSLDIRRKHHRQRLLICARAISVCFFKDRPAEVVDFSLVSLHDGYKVLLRLGSNTSSQLGAPAPGALAFVLSNACLSPQYSLASHRNILSNENSLASAGRSHCSKLFEPTLHIAVVVICRNVTSRYICDSFQILMLYWGRRC